VDRYRTTLSAAVPDQWFVKESMTLLEQNGQANVIFSSEPLDDFDTSRYAETQRNLLQQEFPGYKEVAFEPMLLFGGRDGLIHRFEWSPPDGVPVTQIQVYFSTGQRGFTATATVPTKSVEDFEQTLMDVLEALLIEGALDGAPAALGAASRAEG
jgi:hypothetical protein